MLFHQLLLCLTIRRASIGWRGAIAHRSHIVAAAYQIHHFDRLVIHNFTQHWLLHTSSVVTRDSAFGDPVGVFGGEWLRRVNVILGRRARKRTGGSLDVYDIFSTIVLSSHI